MPNRFQRNSIGELVCHVPLNRGSLLKSIENLVKTIETSENAVMIPTLLRDKVRVDAWELLFVAKILKASILGHDDLVEFYMNHIHQNNLTATATMSQTAAATPSAATQPPAPHTTAPASHPTPNGTSTEPLLSPLLARNQSNPSMVSPLLLSHSTTNGLASASKDKEAPDQATPTGSTNHHPASTSSSASSSSSTHSSQSSSATATTATTGGPQSNNHQTGQSTNKSSTASWITANQQPSSGASLTSGSPFNSSASSSSSSASNAAATPTNGPADSVTNPLENNESPIQMANIAAPLKLAPEEGLLAARPLMARLAQPPSLLQLTTTNNHINSVSEMLNSSPLDPSLDSLSQHLVSLQQQHQQQISQPNGLDSGAGLSLSILTNQMNGLDSSANPLVSTASHQPAPLQPAARHELRSSRSAGCLFRANSGASSPRTPGTPYPQAETLAGAANQNGLVGDPTSLVKLLLQVEQLKASIVHVNTLLESVVELYKKSIDNISQ